MAPTKLDAAQVMTAVYDEPNNRLRTDASLTMSSAVVEVSISQVDDSILVYGKDSGNVNRPILVNTDGSIVVDFTDTEIQANQGDPNTIANAWPFKLTDGTYLASVNADGSINVANVVSVVAPNASISNVTSSIASQTVLAANSGRKGFLLFNDSTQTCYIAFAATASTSMFTMKLIPGMTYQNEAIMYTGVMSAIWDVANGFLRVTELS